MHILIATSSYPLRPDDAFAAAGLFVRDFALGVARAGHRVTVLTHARPGSAADDRELTVVRHGGPAIAKPLARLRPWHPLDVVRSARLVRSGRRAARQLAATNPVDHVLAMWAFPAGFYARDLWQRRGTAYSVWALGSDIWSLAKLPLLRTLIAGILRDAAHRFADGLVLAEATAALCGRRCDFLPSGRFGYRGPLPATAWPGSGCRFVFIGRFESNKGPDVLVEAAALLRRRGANFSLVMFGDGSLRRQVDDLIQQRDLGDRVVWRGYAGPDTAAAYLAAADIVVIPSRIESIPVVFSDALRAGAALVVTDVGDMGTLVRRHQIGEVAAADDPESLARAMNQALQADRSRWRTNSAALASTFSVEGAVTQFLQTIGAASAHIQRSQSAATN